MEKLITSFWGCHIWRLRLCEAIIEEINKTVEITMKTEMSWFGQKTKTYWRLMRSVPRDPQQLVTNFQAKFKTFFSYRNFQGQRQLAFPPRIPTQCYSKPNQNYFKFILGFCFHIAHATRFFSKKANASSFRLRLLMKWSWKSSFTCCPMKLSSWPTWRRKKTKTAHQLAMCLELCWSLFLHSCLLLLLMFLFFFWGNRISRTE